MTYRPAIFFETHKKHRNPLDDRFRCLSCLGFVWTRGPLYLASLTRCLSAAWVKYAISDARVLWQRLCDSSSDTPPAGYRDRYPWVPLGVNSLLSVFKELAYFLLEKTPRAHGRPLLLRGAHITLWVYIYAGYPARVVKDDGKGDRNLFSGLTNLRFEYPVAERMSLGFALHLYKCSQKGKKLTYFRKYEPKYPDYRRIFLKSYAILAVFPWKI